MIRRGLVISLLLIAAVPAAAGAHAFRFVHPGNLPPAKLALVERALEAQGRQAARHWPGASVTFSSSPSAWPIYMVGAEGWAGPAAPCSSDDAGCHGLQGDRPAIWVEVGPFGSETFSLSHEILETAVDPDLDRRVGGMLAEVCDPVNNDDYQVQVGGAAVTVSDFVLPRWFRRGARGPMDEMGMLRRPLAVQAGGGYDGDDGS